MSDEAFRWPCSVWIDAQRRWTECQLYLFEHRLSVELVSGVGQAAPVTASTYLSLELCMLLDARLSYTWSGFRSLVLTSNRAGPGCGNVCWSGAGARDCVTSAGQMWLSSLKSVHSSLNAIQLFRRHCLSLYCRSLSSAPAAGGVITASSLSSASSSSTSPSHGPAVPTSSGESAAASGRGCACRHDDSGGFGALTSRGRRMAQLATLVDDSERTLGAAAGELHAQRQSLDVSQAKLAAINSHLKVAARLVDQVTAFFPSMTSPAAAGPQRHASSEASAAHYVIYMPAGQARMVPGRLGVYASSSSSSSGAGRRGRHNVVLQGADGLVLGDTHASVEPVNRFCVTLTTTDSSGGRSDSKKAAKTTTVWSPVMAQIFDFATRDMLAQTGSLPAAAGAYSDCQRAANSAISGGGGGGGGGVSSSLQRMKVLALHVGDELREQNVMLDEMEMDTSRADDKVRSVTRKAQSAM